jgi:hypothetical protein
MDKPVTLIFTPGAYKCMLETIKKHKDFIYKLNPAIKPGLLEDITTIASILSSAEKAGRKS